MIKTIEIFGNFLLSSADEYSHIMNGIELFRKLGMGAKFNFRRFGADAERLKVAIVA